jgi:hypothetical protein
MSTQRKNGSKPPIEAATSAPSDEALARAAAQMLREIEAQRAACIVQRVTNGHAEDDPFQTRQGPDGSVNVSYRRRLEELEELEGNLRGGMAEAVLARADELAAL